MKIFLLILVLLVLVGGYSYASQHNWLPENAPKITVPELALQGNPQDQFGVLASRAQELGTYAQSFVGSGVKVDDSQPSLSQKAMNYGQYLYCKQVVTTYETKQ